MDGDQGPAMRSTRRLAVVRLPIDFTIEAIIYSKDLVILIIASLGCLACWAIAVVWIYTIQVIPEVLLLTADLLQACVDVGTPEVRNVREIVVEEVEDGFEDVTTKSQSHHENATTASSDTRDINLRSIETVSSPGDDITSPAGPEDDVARRHPASTTWDSADMTISPHMQESILNATDNNDLDEIISWSSGDEDVLFSKSRDRSPSQESPALPERSDKPEKDYYSADRREATSSKVEQKKVSANSEWIARVTGVKPEQGAKTPVFGSGQTDCDFAVAGADVWQVTPAEADIAARRPQPGFTKEQLAAAAADAQEFTRGGNKLRPGHPPRRQFHAPRKTMQTVHNRPSIKPATFVPPRPPSSKSMAAQPVNSIRYSAENLPPHKRKQQAAKNQKSNVDSVKGSGKNAQPGVTKNIYEVLSVDGSAPNSPAKSSPMEVSNAEAPLPATNQFEPQATSTQTSVLDATQPAEAQAQATSTPVPMSPAIVDPPADSAEDAIQKSVHDRGLSHGNAPVLAHPATHAMSIDALKALNTTSLAQKQATGHAANACTMCGGPVFLEVTSAGGRGEILACIDCRAIGLDVQEAQLIVGKAGTALHRRKPSPMCVQCGGEGHRSVYCPMLQPVSDQSKARDSPTQHRSDHTIHQNNVADGVDKTSKPVCEESIGYGNMVSTPYTRFNWAQDKDDEDNRPQLSSRVGADLLEQNLCKVTADSEIDLATAVPTHEPHNLLDLDVEETAPRPETFIAPAGRERGTSSLTPTALPFFAPSSSESIDLGPTPEQADVATHTITDMPIRHHEQTHQPQTDFDGWFGGPMVTYTSSDDYGSATPYLHEYASQGYYNSPAMQSSSHSRLASPRPSDFLRSLRSTPVTIKLPPPDKIATMEPSGRYKDSQKFTRQKLTMAELFGYSKPADGVQEKPSFERQPENRMQTLTHSACSTSERLLEPVMQSSDLRANSKGTPAHVNVQAEGHHSESELVGLSSASCIENQAIGTSGKPSGDVTSHDQPFVNNNAFDQGQHERTAAEVKDNTLCDKAPTSDHLFDLEDSASEASGYASDASASASPRGHLEVFDVSLLNGADGDDKNAATPAAVHNEGLEGSYTPGPPLPHTHLTVDVPIGMEMPPEAAEHDAEKTELSTKSPTAEVLGSMSIMKSLKQQKRDAREELIRAWWVREDARKLVKGTFSLERMQKLEATTREYATKRDALISLMKNGELNEKDAMIFPVLPIHGISEPKYKPPVPDSSTSSTASKGLQKDRSATPEPPTIEEEIHELSEQTEIALNHYYDAVDFFKGRRPQGRQTAATLVTLGKAKADRAKKYYQKKLEALRGACPGALEKAGFPEIDDLEVPHTGDIGTPCMCRRCRRRTVR